MPPRLFGVHQQVQESVAEGLDALAYGVVLGSSLRRGSNKRGQVELLFVPFFIPFAFPLLFSLMVGFLGGGGGSARGYREKNTQPGEVLFLVWWYHIIGIDRLGAARASAEGRTPCVSRGNLTSSRQVHAPRHTGAGGCSRTLLVVRGAAHANTDGITHETRTGIQERSGRSAYAIPR